MSESDIRRDLLEQAKLADQTNRHEEMATFMKQLVELDGVLVLEERTYLSIAYKTIVGARRSSWRIISSIEERSNYPDNRLIEEYREKIGAELREICGEMLQMLENTLIPKADSDASKVFYSKMKGDYLRYMAEISPEDDRQSFAEKALQAYQEASDTAKEKLNPTNSIRLGVALNFAVFCYEIMGSVERASEITKQALDECAAKLDDTHEYGNRDMNMILQLLKDNLALWRAGPVVHDKDEFEVAVEKELARDKPDDKDEMTAENRVIAGSKLTVERGTSANDESDFENETNFENETDI